MRSFVILAALGSAAYAEDVNLLVSTPTTIAVSSTVQNAAIVPDHIADGKLSTAWNSKTGELVGAWVAVRLPADAKVKTIKLTAGFAHKDKKQGDFFTMNPRIKKVRISHNDKQLAEHALDVENRGLQAIPVDVTGGEIEVRVLEVVAGSKPNWKETCISELEVWGSVPAVAKSKPAFRIGGLDMKASLTPEQCVKALFPNARGGRIGAGKEDEAIVTIDVVPVNEQLVVCRVDHKAKDGTDTTHVVGAVKRGARPQLAGTAHSGTTEAVENPDQMSGKRGEVKIELFPLTTTETGVIVELTQREDGPMLSNADSKSTLYRVTAAGLANVLEWKSTSHGGEASESDHCVLRDVKKLGKWMPSTLVLDCQASTSDWHNEDHSQRGTKTKDRVEKFVWKDGSYIPK